MYREILTKAIIAKGKKEFKEEQTLPVEEKISRSLGCWVINHKSEIVREANQIFIEGSYQVFVWYGFDQDTDCKLVNQIFTFKDEIPYLFNDEKEDLTDKNEIKKYVSKQPVCVQLHHQDQTIYFTIERAYSIDIIGETKFTIKVNEQPVNKEPNDITSQINPDYIVDKKQI